jgi:hypothetical protein
MLLGHCRRGLPLLFWFAACACAGRTDALGSTRQEPADGKPEPDDTSRDGSDGDLPPLQPTDDGLSEHLPSPEQRQIHATEASIAACSFHAAEDRVALHHRDADTGTCVDMLLVRQVKGGVALEGLGLPWDWGVGHFSSYPCSSDGRSTSPSEQTIIDDATGDIAMGGGAVGLPAALGLDLSFSASVAGSDARVYYLFEASNLDVTRACDDSTPWALQPLNQGGEVTPSEFRGCTYIGAYDRVTFQHRDPATATCTSLTLIAYDETGYLSEGLSLPANWSVEYMDYYGCAQDGAALTDAYSFTDAVGEVIFGEDTHGLPDFAWLDVTLSAREEESASPVDPPAGPLPPPQRLLGKDAVDLSGDCTGPW